MKKILFTILCLVGLAGLVNGGGVMGYTTVGGSTDYWNGEYRGTCFNASEDGTAMNITWYIPVMTASDVFNTSFALYNGSGTTYTYMARTEYALLTQPSAKWFSFPLINNVSIWKQGRYCVIIFDNQTSGSHYIRFSYTTNASWTSWHKSQTWASYPAATVAAPTVAGQMWSAYLGYYTGGGNTNPITSNVSVYGMNFFENLTEMDDLACKWLVKDVEDASLTCTDTWYQNGVNRNYADDSLSCTSDGATWCISNKKMLSLYTSVGDVWSCNVTCTDSGALTGVNATSVTLIRHVTNYSGYVAGLGAVGGLAVGLYVLRRNR